MGLSADYVKLGGLSGAERMNKYNRLISIEEELERQGLTGTCSILGPRSLPGRERGGQTKTEGERRLSAHTALSLCVCES